MLGKWQIIIHIYNPIVAPGAVVVCPLPMLRAWGGRVPGPGWTRAC